MGCVGQLMTSGRVSCVVNPTAAKELTQTFDPADRTGDPKRILVAGGGPAGLEFARTATLRGHEVELCEAGQRLGGQVLLAAAAPHRADLGTIVHWLADEVEALGVRVSLNTLVDEDLVAERQPDEVIVATGTAPRADGLLLMTPRNPVSGFDLPHVHDAWSLFGMGRAPDLRGPAVIYDDTGSFEAISVADVLLEAGLDVTMVSRFDAPGASLPYPPVTAGAARERLYSGAFDFVGGHYIRSISVDAVEIGVQFTPRSRTLAAKTVVLVGYNEPNRELAESLNAQGRRCHLIGDVGGRNSIMNAIHSASALGRSI
jgi:hypothetical protein